jgi:hypothetical protein
VLVQRRLYGLVVTEPMVQVMKNDKSWRGMLLKDNEGDWGVAVAAWRGMKKGQPGVPGTRGQKGKPGLKGNPGHFAMKFINLRRPGSKPVFVVLPSENKKYTFYINNVKVAALVLRVEYRVAPGEPEEGYNHGAPGGTGGRAVHQVIQNFNSDRVESAQLLLCLFG